MQEAKHSAVRRRIGVYEKKTKHEKSANRSPPREGVRMVLERQRDVEAQFWAVYCQQLRAKIRRLSQEVCYGCIHRKTDEKHHNTCQMSDEVHTSSYGDGIG